MKHYIVSRVQAGKKRPWIGVSRVELSRKELKEKYEKFVPHQPRWTSRHKIGGKEHRRRRLWIRKLVRIVYWRIRGGFSNLEDTPSGEVCVAKYLDGFQEEPGEPTEGATRRFIKANLSHGVRLFGYKMENYVNKMLDKGIPVNEVELVDGGEKPAGYAVGSKWIEVYVEADRNSSLQGRYNWEGFGEWP